MKWQHLRQWKYQSVQSYTNEFYRLMARLSVQEEEKLLVLNYINILSPYILQEMEFLILNTLQGAFHYTSNIEVK